MTTDRLEISAEEAAALLARVKRWLPEEDFRIIKGLVDTHLLLNQAMNEKSISIKRLLQMIFGSKTEKSNQGDSRKRSSKGQVKGHGRKSAADYSGATTCPVPHQSLHHCDPCPACRDGRVYRQAIPGVVVRIKGCAPLQGTIYELEKLRCNICGKIFTADMPPAAGEQKYDESAADTPVKIWQAS